MDRRPRYRGTSRTHRSRTRRGTFRRRRDRRAALRRESSGIQYFKRTCDFDLLIVIRHITSAFGPNQRRNEHAASEQRQKRYECRSSSFRQYRRIHAVIPNREALGQLRDRTTNCIIDDTKNNMLSLESIKIFSRNQVAERRNRFPQSRRANFNLEIRSKSTSHFKQSRILPDNQ